MKVVHLNTTDLGGSYKAAERIHKGMILAGAQSSLLLRTKYDRSREGYEVIDSPLKSLISKSKNVGNLLLSTSDIITDAFGTDVTRLDEVRAADAIVVHWCNSFLGYSQYRRLKALGKPVLVVGHDMWPCTGGCHYDGGCGKYPDGCQGCPMIKNRLLSAILQNTVNKNYKAKTEAFAGCVYVGVSNWSLSVAEKSPIWENNVKTAILNPVDYDVFKPTKPTKYEYLRENPDQKIILYGAAKAFSEKYKGGDELYKVMAGLDIDNCKLVVFGGGTIEFPEELKIPAVSLGYIGSESDMAQLYSFADVFVNTSYQESFCYTVGEALACKTPVVAYGVGGIRDQIRHEVNGYLVPYGDINGVVQGIEYCFSHSMESVDLHNSLSEIGRRYLEFIETLISQTHL